MLAKQFWFTFLIVALLAVGNANPLAANTAGPGGLRVESLTEPVGLDTAQPRFSWEIGLPSITSTSTSTNLNPQSKGEGPVGLRDRNPQFPHRGLRQTACQIVVATTTATLERGGGELLWDSGRVASAQSHLVPYEGKPLESSRRYFWKVRFWDETDAPSPWSAPATWISGLLSPLSEWRVEWLGLDAPSDSPPDTPSAGADPYGLAEALWITHPDTGGPADFYPFSFRASFRVEKAALRRATLAAHSDNNLAAFCQVFANGVELGQFGWACPKIFDLTGWLRDGENTITFRDTPRLIGSILLEYADGRTERIRSGAEWFTSRATLDHWDAESIRRAPWVPAQVLARNGRAPLPTRVDVSRTLGPPVVRLRREFTLRRPVRLAVLHATALGLCEVFLNGRRAGDEQRFQPGWTQYDRRIDLVSTDVTALVRPGANALGAELADGWFAGHMAWFGRNPDAHPRFAAQLHVEYDDGTREVIATAPGWKARPGPTLQADLMLGETCDARLETPGWSEPGFDDRAWTAATTGDGLKIDVTPRFIDVTSLLREAIRTGRVELKVDDTLGGDPAPGSAKQLVIDFAMGNEERTAVLDDGQTLNLPQRDENFGMRLEIHRARYGHFRNVKSAPVPRIVAGRPCPPPQPFERLAPAAIREPRPGIYVFDFGRNLTGWTRLVTHGEAGRRVLIRYAEALRPDGTLDTNSLRSISPADTLILKGGGEESWEPRFTYHGFRYAQLAGLAAPPTTATLTAIAAGSAGPITSTFHCSSSLIDRLYQAVCNTQRANLFEVPLSGPARDERLGQLADFAPFLATALYNQRGLDTFAGKVLLDVLDRQTEDGTRQNGNFGKIAPVSPAMGSAMPAPLDGGVEAVLIPWALYQFHGDLAPARQAYPALRRYLNYVEQTVRGMEGAGSGMSLAGGGAAEEQPVQGDLFGPVPTAPRPLIARACAALAAARMADLAVWTGHPGDAEHYRAFAQHARAIFRTSHILPDGRIESDSQTAYALALRLVDAERRPALAARFIQRVEQDDCHPRVGMIGAGALLGALGEAERPDLACRVLTCPEAPSWAAMLEAGATTIWESWTREGNPSLSRLPLASCGEWLFRGILGIEPLEPGFRRLRIAPEMGCGLAFAEGSVLTAYGAVGCAWRVEGGKAALAVRVPPNTTAEVRLPAIGAAEVQESGRSVKNAPGVKVVKGGKKMTILAVVSGEYRFEWPAAK